VNVRNVFQAVHSALKFLRWIVPVLAIVLITEVFSQRPDQLQRPDKRWRRLVDVLTIGASIATVVLLCFFLLDRRDQANIAAWQLLQSYVQHDPRAQYELGQSFALQTLVQNGVSLDGLGATNARVRNANLQGANLNGASFKQGALESVILTHASLFRADLSGAFIDHCSCERAVFSGAGLFHATLVAGNFQGADFKEADISDLRAPSSLLLAVIFGKSAKKEEVEGSPDLFSGACYQKGHEPWLPEGMSLPRYPQSPLCIHHWGKQWAERDKTSGLQPPH
jgi:Pentapeptide repeats (8 copies)